MRSRVAVFLWLGAIAGAAMGGQHLTMEAAVALALEKNPEIRAARIEICKAQARLIDAGKLENPVLELGVESSLHTNAEREGAAFAGISQSFPITHRLRHEKDWRVADIKLAAAEVRDGERRFIGEVQREFIAVLTSRAKRSVLAQLEADTGDFVDLAKKRLEQALGSELDVASAETERILAAQALRTGEGELSIANARLLPRLGLAPGVTVTPAETLDEVIGRLRRSVRMAVPSDLERTDVVAARERKSKAEAGAWLAISERLEDWEIALGYESERSIDEPIGAEREHFVGLGVKIPLPFRKRGQGRIEEALAEKGKAELLLEQIRREALAEVEAGIAAVRTASATVDSIENRILPLLDERERKTRRAYQDGLIDIVQVVQLQQQRARIGESLIAAKGEQALALSELQTALGTHPALCAAKN